MRIDEEMIRSFSRKLDEIHYELFITLVVGSDIYRTPFFPYYKIKTELKKYDEYYQKILSFFFLGDPCDYDIIEKLLGEKLIEYLFANDIINYDDYSCWMNNYLLIPYMNCYFLVSNTTNYPTCQDSTPRPYIGVDSYWLARNLVNNVHGNVLDVCTGSGIQAIISAKSADFVVAVDIDSKALEIAGFNAFLNGVGGKINFREGDLYDVIEDEKFDYIVSNPPFIPIPDKVKYPICGDGGEDGKEIVNRILAGYSKYLAPGGCAIMIGQALGDDKRTFFEDDIDRLCPCMSATLFLWDNEPISVLVGETRKMAREANIKSCLSFNEWEECFFRQGASELYTFTLYVHNEKGKLTTVCLRDHWNMNDVPNVTLRKTEKVGENYGIYFSGNAMFTGTEEQKYFLENADGERTVGEIVSGFPLRYKVRHSDSEWSMISAYLSFCSMLERMGVITKERRTSK